MKIKTPWTEKFVGIMICLITFALVVCITMSAMDGTICQTPFGARDFRCMGYFSNHH